MEGKFLPNRLKALRKLKGVNQEQAAEACNISRIALARYENGVRIPKTDVLPKLAAYYGVTVDYLLGTNSPEAQKWAEIKLLVEQMTDEEFDEALTVLQIIHEKYQKKKRGK